MAMRFLRGILASKVIASLILFSALFSSSSFAAVPWFATYKAGVLSGSAGTGVVSTQPYFSAAGNFMSILVQPFFGSEGSRTPDLPDYSFGGILASGDIDIRKENASGGGTSETEDAYARGFGGFIEPLVNYQQILASASELPSGSCNSMLISNKLDPVVYKLSLACLDDALSALTGPNRYSLKSDGVTVLIVDGASPTDTLEIANNVIASGPDQRLMIITNTRVDILNTLGIERSALGTYFTTAENIQAGIISVADSASWDIRVASTGGAATDKPIKLEGPIAAKGPIVFARELDIDYPPVLLVFNPIYAYYLSALDGVLPSVSSIQARWTYD